MPPELADDLLGEILLRLPPDDPACLLRASLACKRWRRILADPVFRRRHREIHRAPSVVGFLGIVSGNVPYCSRFVPNNPASGRLAGRDLPGWLVSDCRHGRALFVTPAQGPDTEGDLDFVVWDPLTDERRRLPPPSPTPTVTTRFNAAVLCSATAVGGCDHRGCHGGPFRAVFVFTTWTSAGWVTSARVYSSETDDWSEPTSIQQHPYVHVHIDPSPCPSALVGDTLYFRGSHRYAIEYQLGAQRLSVIDQPPWCMYKGGLMFLMPLEDSVLGLAEVEEEPSLSLCLWSRETSPDGVMQWARGRAIELEMLLPYAALPPQRLAFDGSRWIQDVDIVGFAEGTDIILVGFDHDVYMIELNSRRSKKVFDHFTCVVPYTSFSVPGIAS
ncbi:hypothetical protein C2845_PM05G11330 [Panicum miliaceum]|uniref:F-box domain-containing protein n=1 Tax=Panicum miliaceum TaxID=4540 RepID=A0A3L6SY38_PANMI|nr:hypothetical protein C2845_PM05G11330 [Panicum miliaceum]